MNKTIDLHVHSTASDGTFTPTELVAEAKRCGLSAFALTDHDTVDGISEALAAGEASGLEVIPGVELSTEYNETEIHVVGLFIDPANTDLQAELAKFRDNRTTASENDRKTSGRGIPDHRRRSVSSESGYRGGTSTHCKISGGFRTR